MKPVYSILLLALLILSCQGNTDDWKAGDLVAQDCQQVYFTSQSEAVPDILEGDSSQIVISVKRNTSVGELEVPIQVVDADPALTIPTQVVFHDGEDSTAIKIVGPEQLEAKHAYQFHIALQGKHVDPYAQLAGSTTFRGTMQLSIPEYLSCALQNFTTAKVQYIYQKAYLRTGKLVIPNFMGTGVKMEVSYADNGNVKLNSLGIAYEDGSNAWTESAGTAELNAYALVDEAETYYNYDNCPYDLWFYTTSPNYQAYYPDSKYLFLTYYAYTMDSGPAQGYYYMYIYTTPVPEDELTAGTPIF